MSPIGLIIAGLTILGVAIYKNWDTVKKWIAAIMNYFIDLYNESIIFRGAVQFIIAVFKNLWAQVKFTFNAMKGLIGTLIESWVGQFKALAKIISSALKLDLDGVKEGGKDYVKAVKDGITGSKDVLLKEGEILGKEMADNLATAVDNTLNATKIEYVSPDDIQAGADAIGDMAKNGFDKFKSFFAGGGSELDFEGMFTDDGTDGTTGTDGGGDPQTEKLAKQKSALRLHLEGMSEGWKNYFKKQDESWENWGETTAEAIMTVANFSSEVMGQLDAVAEQRHKNKMQTLDNEYNQDIANLEARGLSEEEFADKKKAIDEKYQDKKKALEVKAAKREKKMAIFQAIINTAAGIAKAIPNPYLMAFAGIMGAAQVAAISSAPIPMATGALAFSPTNAIVGDNPNAQNDPEVIAPLSKLTQILQKTGGGGVTRVVGQISGGEIVLSSDKANIGLARYA